MEKWSLPANVNGLLVVYNYMSMVVGHQGDDLRTIRGMMEKIYRNYYMSMSLSVKKALCILIYVPFFS